MGFDWPLAALRVRTDKPQAALPFLSSERDTPMKICNRRAFTLFQMLIILAFLAIPTGAVAVRPSPRCVSPPPAPSPRTT